MLNDYEFGAQNEWSYYRDLNKNVIGGSDKRSLYKQLQEKKPFSSLGRSDVMFIVGKERKQVMGDYTGAEKLSVHTGRKTNVTDDIYYDALKEYQAVLDQYEERPYLAELRRFKKEMVDDVFRRKIYHEGIEEGKKERTTALKGDTLRNVSGSWEKRLNEMTKEELNFTKTSYADALENLIFRMTSPLTEERELQLSKSNEIVDSAMSNLVMSESFDLVTQRDKLNKLFGLSDEVISSTASDPLTMSDDQMAIELQLRDQVDSNLKKGRDELKHDIFVEAASDVAISRQFSALLSTYRSLMFYFEYPTWFNYNIVYNIINNPGFIPKFEWGKWFKIFISTMCRCIWW